LDKEKFLNEFNQILANCRSEYIGPESDIGNWIYSQPRKNNYDDLNRVANACLFKIRRGLSIKI
jgi:hypothetical protein